MSSRPGRSAPYGLAALLALAAPALPSAAEPPIRFVRPYTPQRLTWMPVDAVIDFDAAADEASLLVHLNGTDVTSAFAIAAPEGGRRRATALLWDGLVALGPNELDAAIDLAGVPQEASAIFTAIGDPYADQVASFVVGSQGGFNAGNLAIALGAPQGTGPFQGSLHVVSLGFGGALVLRFLDNRIVDGPGVDLTVFENSFLPIGAGMLTQPPFAEPGRVSVSQDGVHWHPFAACALVESGAPYWAGCAGVYPVLSDGTPATPHASIPSDVPIQDLVGVPAFDFPLPAGSGGDSFDLAEVGLAWASYVKIEAASFATGPVGTNNAGFDLDAAAAVNSAPPPMPAAPVPALAPAAVGLLAALLGASGAWMARRRRS